MVDSAEDRRWDCCSGPTESALVVRDQDDWQQIVHNEDELTVPDILPTFSVRVYPLFE
jgi:hypothetical protein